MLSVDRTPGVRWTVVPLVITSVLTCCLLLQYLRLGIRQHVHQDLQPSPVNEGLVHARTYTGVRKRCNSTCIGLRQTAAACSLPLQQHACAGVTVLRSAVAARRARAVATRCCTARSDEYIAYSIWCSTLPAAQAAANSFSCNRLETICSSHRKLLSRSSTCDLLLQALDGLLHTVLGRLHDQVRPLQPLHAACCTRQQAQTLVTATLVSVVREHDAEVVDGASGGSRTCHQ